MSGIKKCAFVTGGSHGIGAGICEVLAGEGYDIAFTYNTNPAGAEETAAAVRAKGARCFFYQASLEKADVCESVTARAIEDLGRLDLLVNNAGVTMFNRVYGEESTEDFYSFLYSLNWRAPMLCAKIAVRHMIDRAIKGSIVNISSSRGTTAYPTDPTYGGLKAALNRATESMALQFAPYGIRANVIAPGMTIIDRPFDDAESLTGGFSPKIPLRRNGSPYDVGNAVAFLASDKASYITGAQLRIDGGLTLPGIPETNAPEAGTVGWDDLSFWLKREGTFREPKEQEVGLD